MPEFKVIEVKQRVLENIGNLVCPAEFDTCAVKNAMILSAPEGHDKPIKYPLMFTICDVLLINKIDVMNVSDFDLEKCKEYIWRLNPDMKVIPICAKTGDAFAAVKAFYNHAGCGPRRNEANPVGLLSLFLEPSLSVALLPQKAAIL